MWSALELRRIIIAEEPAALSGHGGSVREEVRANAPCPDLLYSEKSSPEREEFIAAHVLRTSGETTF
jgi:hypothetical protein